MSEKITKKILKEMEQMSKGGEGSGQKGHKTEGKDFPHKYGTLSQYGRPSTDKFISDWVREDKKLRKNK